MRIFQKIRLRAGALAALLTAALASFSPSRNAESRPAGQAAGSVAGQVEVKQKGLLGTSAKSNRSGVVVYLENVPGPAPAPSGHAAIRQRDKTFVPRVIAVPRGAPVEFPNDDKIFHNVFSLSQAGKFDLGLYKSGSSKSVSFDKAGVVDVYCNIHPDMVATIRVLDSGWFAVTDGAGRFRIHDVPAGTYPIVAWVPRGEEVRGTVTITPGETAQARLEVLEAGGAAHHSRKDGTPYGRYQ